MINAIVQLLDAVTKLIGVVIWPILLMVAVTYFAPALQDFVKHLGEGTIKGPGFEISGKRQLDATAAITTASVSRLNLTANLSPDDTKALQDQISKSITGSAKAVNALNSAATQSTKQARQILWVDDTPSNNTYEKQAFESLGFTVTNALSTDEALDQVRRRKFDLIISDMGRPEGRQAGYDLLAKLKDAGVNAPFIIYTSANTPEMRQEALRRGAFATTNQPDELIHLAADALAKA
jgi:CheY-like chemotaxis protein